MPAFRCRQQPQHPAVRWGTAQPRAGPVPAPSRRLPTSPSPPASQRERCGCCQSAQYHPAGNWAQSPGRCIFNDTSCLTFALVFCMHLSVLDILGLSLSCSSTCRWQQGSACRQGFLSLRIAGSFLQTSFFWHKKLETEGCVHPDRWRSLRRRLCRCARCGSSVRSDLPVRPQHAAQQHGDHGANASHRSVLPGWHGQALPADGASARSCGHPGGLERGPCCCCARAWTGLGNRAGWLLAADDAVSLSTRRPSAVAKPLAGCSVCLGFPNTAPPQDVLPVSAFLWPGR